jgi:ribonuclease HI
METSSTGRGSSTEMAAAVVVDMTGYTVAEGQFDGGSRGNPGPAAWAFGIWFPAVKAGHTMTGSIGETTSNVAEYHGLINLLKYAVSQRIKHLTVRGDSMLVIQQMSGKWKVKHDDLKKLHQEAQVWASQIDHVEYKHVPREENTEADALVNTILGPKKSRQGKGSK